MGDGVRDTIVERLPTELKRKFNKYLSTMLVDNFCAFANISLLYACIQVSSLESPCRHVS